MGRIDNISAVSRAEIAVAQLRANAVYGAHVSTITPRDSREIDSDVIKMEQIVEEIHRRVYSQSDRHRIDLVA